MPARCRESGNGQGLRQTAAPQGGRELGSAAIHQDGTWRGLQAGDTRELAGSVRRVTILYRFCHRAYDLFVLACFASVGVGLVAVFVPECGFARIQLPLR